MELPSTICPQLFASFQVPRALKSDQGPQTKWRASQLTAICLQQSTLSTRQLSHVQPALFLVIPHLFCQNQCHSVCLVSLQKDMLKRYPALLLYWAVFCWVPDRPILSEYAPEGKRVTKNNLEKTAARGDSPPTSNNQMPLTMPLAECKRSAMKYFSQLNQCYKHLVLRGTSSCHTSSAKASGSWHPRARGIFQKHLQGMEELQRKEKISKLDLRNPDSNVDIFCCLWVTYKQCILHPPLKPPKTHPLFCFKKKLITHSTSSKGALLPNTLYPLAIPHAKAHLPCFGFKMPRLTKNTSGKKATREIWDLNVICDIHEELGELTCYEWTNPSIPAHQRHTFIRDYPSLASPIGIARSLDVADATGETVLQTWDSNSQP